MRRAEAGLQLGDKARKHSFAYLGQELTLKHFSQCSCTFLLLRNAIVALGVFRQEKQNRKLWRVTESAFGIPSINVEDMRPITLLPARQNNQSYSRSTGLLTGDAT